MSVADVEEPKRLRPTPDSQRKLYAHSGNLCAYPSCMEIMIDSEGVFKGEIAHIEAAEKGGPRFNAKMTNEERRHPDNLMLLCRNHHNEIDTHPERYPVHYLQDMKAGHEVRFINPAIAIGRGLEDWDETPSLQPPQNLERFLVARKYGNNPKSDRQRQFLAAVQKAVRILATVDYRDRAFFERLCTSIADTGRSDSVLPESVLRFGLELSYQRLAEYMTNLEHYHLATLDLREYTDDKPVLVVYDIEDCPFFVELVLFARDIGIPPSTYFNLLDFRTLDDPWS